MNDETRTVRYYASRSDFEKSFATHVIPLDDLAAVHNVEGKLLSCGGAAVFQFEMRFRKEQNAEVTDYQSVPSRRDSNGGKRSSSARNIWSGCGVVWHLGTDTERERSRWVEGLQRRSKGGAPEAALSGSAQPANGDGSQEKDKAGQEYGPRSTVHGDRGGDVDRGEILSLTSC